MLPHHSTYSTTPRTLSLTALCSANDNTSPILWSSLYKQFFAQNPSSRRLRFCIDPQPPSAHTLRLHDSLNRRLSSLLIQLRSGRSHLHADLFRTRSSLDGSIGTRNTKSCWSASPTASQCLTTQDTKHGPSLPTAATFRHPNVKTENILPILIIRGPRKPKNINTFLLPFLESAKVSAWNGRGEHPEFASSLSLTLMLLAGACTGDGQAFTFRCYVLPFCGDMPAMAMLQKMK